MIDQLKNIPAKVCLYDLIATFHAHREVLYALFKNEIIPTNILATTFFKKLRTLREGDTISFHKSEKLNRELLNECFTLYITPMLDGWEVKRTMVDNGSTVNMCFNYFLTQLQENGIELPPLEEAIFRI